VQQNGRLQGGGLLLTPQEQTARRHHATACRLQNTRPKTPNTSYLAPFFCRYGLMLLYCE
jgi:hypothetical protein